MRRREFLAIGSGSAIAAIASPLARARTADGQPGDARALLALWYRANGSAEWAPAHVRSAGVAAASEIQLCLHGVEAGPGIVPDFDRLDVDLLFPASNNEHRVFHALQHDTRASGHAAKPVSLTVPLATGRPLQLFVDIRSGESVRAGRIELAPLAGEYLAPLSLAARPSADPLRSPGLRFSIRTSTVNAAR